MTNGMITNGIDSDMPKYDINKLRSAGLRYLAVDKDGQAWRLKQWNLKGRRICMPVSDIPIDLKWEDEPYDILENGLVRKEDFKIWPDFRKC